jgi:hypothetical protein
MIRQKTLQTIMLLIIDKFAVVSYTIIMYIIL